MKASSGVPHCSVWFFIACLRGLRTLLISAGVLGIGACRRGGLGTEELEPGTAVDTEVIEVGTAVGAVALEVLEMGVWGELYGGGGGGEGAEGAAAADSSKLVWGAVTASSLASSALATLSALE